MRQILHLYKIHKQYTHWCHVQCAKFNILFFFTPVERVKANITPSLLQSEPKLKEEHYKSEYTVEYPTKQGDGDPSGYVPRPIPCQNADYLRSVQEKMFREPPRPISPGISETKQEYCAQAVPDSSRIAFPPNNFAYCEIRALGRDEQPPVRPEQCGYYRYMDPYMTTNRISYVPFTIDQQDGLSRKDIVTFYDASGYPRGGKGYGPKNCTEVEPLFRTQIGTMVDRTVFKTKTYNKILPRYMKRIPNYGMQSEYQGKYTKQTYYDSFPTIHATLENYDESLPRAGPWQTLTVPGMYCSDYCHIGTGWPVRSVIELKKPEKYIEKDVDLCRNSKPFISCECYVNNN
ncbi:hypothetical protein QE152_g32538 [Popillia japonica]|uniref:Uncharacterized protein n=1 Tax=Popillia japonica TaxID=7064 RepID=A0AAW1IYI8_POPJA